MVYDYNFYKIKLDLLLKDRFRIEKQEWKSVSGTLKIFMDPDSGSRVRKTSGSAWLRERNNYRSGIRWSRSGTVLPIWGIEIVTFQNILLYLSFSRKSCCLQLHDSLQIIELTTGWFSKLTWNIVTQKLTRIIPESCMFWCPETSEPLPSLIGPLKGVWGA